MTSAAWMAAASVVSWLAAAAALGPRVGGDVFAGMLGPLVAASASWLVVERTFRHDPARVTGLMMAAFLAKMMFFGAYVAAALKLLALDPVPFVVSFTTYFIALYLAEALLLRRLFRDRQA
jgi:hypothetical protein